MTKQTEMFKLRKTYIHRYVCNPNRLHKQKLINYVLKEPCPICMDRDPDNRIKLHDVFVECRRCGHTWDLEVSKDAKDFN